MPHLTSLGPALWDKGRTFHRRSFLQGTHITFFNQYRHNTTGIIIGSRSGGNINHRPLLWRATIVIMHKLRGSSYTKRSPTQLECDPERGWPLILCFEWITVAISVKAYADEEGKN